MHAFLSLIYSHSVFIFFNPFSTPSHQLFMLYPVVNSEIWHHHAIKIYMPFFLSLYIYLSLALSFPHSLYLYVYIFQYLLHCSPSTLCALFNGIPEILIYIYTYQDISLSFYLFFYLSLCIFPTLSHYLPLSFSTLLHTYTPLAARCSSMSRTSIGRSSTPRASSVSYLAF